MCNGLHIDSKPIPKSGYGWKIVIGEENRLIYSLVWESQYRKGKTGLIQWDGESDKGFCFFLKKKDAIRACALWPHRSMLWPCQGGTVVKIRYLKGMGKHQEHRFIGGHSFETAICKSFRFVK